MHVGDEPGRMVTMFMPDDCIKKVEAAARRDSRTSDQMVATAIRQWKRNLKEEDE